MLHYQRISSEGKCFVKTPLVSVYDGKTEEGAYPSMPQYGKF